MTWLMVAQWFVGIGFAVIYSPLTWIGQNYQVHIHVWVAILLGGAISGFAILWSRTFPESAHSRHVMAISQMLWSALFIHLSGGRIEAHFHVFASLAILSIYRDWKILISATIVVAIDHFIRGVFYPLSAFGIVTASPYRWIEHAVWVLFEVSFLAPGCMRLRNEIRELCVRQTEIEEAKRSVDVKVQQRTQELMSANQLVANKTEEAEKLALVAQHTDNAVVISDSEFRIEWVNEGFTRITGYSLEDVQGKRPADFQFGPKTDPIILDRMRTAIRNKTGFDAEVVNYRKNGEPYWMAIEVRPISIRKGNVSRFIAIQSDVSHRKAMEFSLAATEQRLRSLLNNVSGAFYRCQANEDQQMLFMSCAIGEISGYEPDEFVESRVVTKSDLVHPDDRELVNKMITKAIDNRNNFEIEYRIIDRHQNTKWVWERGQFITEDGCVFLDGTIFDISERKMSEAELASKGQVIEDSLNEIYIFDVETLRFIYVNRVGRENLGYGPEELTQFTPLNIKPEFTLEMFEQTIEPLKTGEQKQIVFRTPHLRKDGSTYVAEVRLQKSQYHDRDVFLAIILDVTEQIKAEAKNNQLQRELVDASRNAGMAEVATGVLHNVGNILNSVNVSATLIRKQLENSAFANLERASKLILEQQDDFADFVRNDNRGRKLPEYLLKITDALATERSHVRNEFDDLLSNVEHIKEIVSAQQSMAKASGVDQELDPKELVSSVLSATKGLLTNHHIAVSQQFHDSHLGCFVSDKHKILQILINLLGNAKDALVEHNTPKPMISIEVSGRNDDIVFRVVDNGIGIPADLISKMFQHGFTTKNNGHGFGLHSSANAATELGGQLTAFSEGAWMGACFELTVPRKRKTPKNPQVDLPSSQLTVSNKK